MDKHTQIRITTHGCKQRHTIVSTCWSVPVIVNGQVMNVTGFIYLVSFHVYQHDFYRIYSTWAPQKLFKWTKKVLSNIYYSSPVDSTTAQVVYYDGFLQIPESVPTWWGLKFNTLVMLLASVCHVLGCCVAFLSGDTSHNPFPLSELLDPVLPSQLMFHLTSITLPSLDSAHGPDALPSLCLAHPCLTWTQSMDPPTHTQL